MIVSLYLVMELNNLWLDLIDEGIIRQHRRAWAHIDVNREVDIWLKAALDELAPRGAGFDGPREIVLTLTEDSDGGLGLR